MKTVNSLHLYYFIHFVIDLSCDCPLQLIDTANTILQTALFPFFLLSSSLYSLPLSLITTTTHKCNSMPLYIFVESFVFSVMYA